MEDEERHLLRTIARRTRAADETFTQVLELAHHGVGPRVSLLVSGRWIEGQLTKPEDWADALDDGYDIGLGLTSEKLEQEHGAIENVADIEPGAVTLGDAERLREQLRGSFRKRCDEAREREDSIRERFKALGDETPPDDLMDEAHLITDPLKVITLREAVVLAESPFLNRHVPVLRVLRSHVGAWHIGGTTHYKSEPSEAT